MRGISRQATVAAVVATFTVLCSPRAEAGLMIGTFAFPSSNTVVDHQQSDDFGLLSGTITYERPFGGLAIVFVEASPQALKVRVDATGEGRGGFTRLSGDVIFSMPGAAPGATTTVTLNADVTGRFETVSGNPGMRYFVTMNLGGGSSANFSEGNDGDDFVLVDDEVFITRTVPVNRSVPFFVQFRAGVFAPQSFDSGISDFANSLTFNPDQFFTVQPGVTVNSVVPQGEPHWLVNNQVVGATAAVPEPSSLTIFGIGAVGLLGTLLRKRRAA
jgi:hypothetical protein